MIYKASIHLFVDVENEAEACDAVGEMLRDHLRKFAPQSCLVDWQYSNWSTFPSPATEEEIADLET